MPEDPELLVGQLRDKILVFDPSMQLDGAPHVFLWAFPLGEMEKYIGGTVAPLVDEVQDTARVATAIQEFRKWRAEHSVAWLAEEKVYYDARYEKENAWSIMLEEMRKARMERIERIKQVQQTQQNERVERIMRLRAQAMYSPTWVPRRWFRVAHCYACRTSLDGVTNPECATCRWMKCDCGACGCGYMGLI